MPAVKTYTRVNFQNYPSTSTPLNATNLNKMDKGIDDLDDEVVTVKNAIENMSFDADSISYNNTSSGLQATDVQGAVDEINDNLNGFTFYPAGEVDLVASVSDDSYYTDANGKYVLADSTTGESLIDNVTYKSLASNEDLRGEVGADTAVPFKDNTKAVTIYLSARGGKYQNYVKTNQFIADLVISNTTIQSVKCGNMPVVNSNGIITNVTYNVNYPISVTIGDLSSGQLIYNLYSVRISKESAMVYRIFADVSSSTAKTGALATMTVTTTFEWLVDFDDDTITIVNDYAITGNTSTSFIAVSAGLMINS